MLPSGINVLLVSSAQRVGRVSHKTQGFPFYQLSSVQSEREWWKEYVTKHRVSIFCINIPEVSRRCDVTPEVETVTYRVYRVLSQQVCVC